MSKICHLRPGIQKANWQFPYNRTSIAARSPSNDPLSTVGASLETAAHSNLVVAYTVRFSTTIRKPFPHTPDSFRSTRYISFHDNESTMLRTMPLHRCVEMISDGKLNKTFRLPCAHLSQ